MPDRNRNPNPNRNNPNNLLDTIILLDRTVGSVGIPELSGIEILDYSRRLYSVEFWSS